jgi:hypothetical protein
MPVIALPRIRPVSSVGLLSIQRWQVGQSRMLTVDIALPFIGLGNEEVRYVSSNMILVTCRVATEDLL